MKRLVRSYTSFIRPERNGLIGVCLLLAAVIAIKALITERKHEVGEEERMLAAYQEQKRQHSTTTGIDATSPITPSAQSQKSFIPIAIGTAVQTFDPNTVDSLTLHNFGLRPITISNLMKWRAKGKRFYRKEDLKPLYTLTTEQYNMLAPHIHIKRQQIDLNHADSVTLLKLRGIGPKLAHKILVRRTTTGPFTHHNQLKELYHFPDTVFERLVEEIVITP